MFQPPYISPAGCSTSVVVGATYGSAVPNPYGTQRLYSMDFSITLGASSLTFSARLYYPSTITLENRPLLPLQPASPRLHSSIVVLCRIHAVAAERLSIHLMIIATTFAYASDLAGINASAVHPRLRLNTIVSVQ